MLAACEPDEQHINGYVEGEYLYIAPSSAGILAKLSVERGDEVKAGDPLFALDLTSLQAAELSADAELQQAKSRWADLTKGKRPEEMDVIAQQKAQAEATLRNAEKQWIRSQELVKKNFTTKAQLDADKAAYEAAKARVAELEASLKTAQLGGREDELAMAGATIDMANQKLLQAQKLLQESAPPAPQLARIEDTYYRPGEYVAAGAPVVSLLPPENIKVRFFIAQKTLPHIKAGAAVHIHCDGCKALIPAHITFISSQAEFTPPVIYSVGSREKLVFMIEAKPDQFAPELHPGLPIDISLGPS